MLFSPRLFLFFSITVSFWALSLFYIIIMKFKFSGTAEYTVLRARWRSCMWLL